MTYIINYKGFDMCVCGTFLCKLKSSDKETFFKSSKTMTIHRSNMGVRIGLNTPLHERQIQTLEM